MRLTSLLLTTSLLACGAAAAATPARPLTADYTDERYEVRDGLAHSTINTIVQTSDGYLWFGTQEGLSRFDGVRFTTFDHVTTPTIADSFIQALAVDRDGSLLVGTTGGGVTRTRHGTWERLRVNTPDARDVYALAVSPDGTLWVGTNHGLYGIRPTSLRRFDTADGLGSNDVRSLLAEPDGTIWAGTARGGVSRIVGATVTTYTTAHGALASNDVLALTRHPDGTVLVATGSGISSFRDGASTRIDLPLSPDSVIQALAVARDGSLWIGTSNDGLFLRQQGTLRHLPLEDDPATNISALSIDRDGALWVGTGGWGVRCIRARRVQSISAPEGLASPVAWAVLESRDGSLWVGSDGGLNRLDPDGAVRSTYSLKQGFSTAASTSLCEGADGSIWSGGEDGQLRRILPDGRVRTLQLGGPTEDRAIRAITADADHSLWVGTGSALFELDPSTAAIRRTYSTSDGLPHDGVRAIVREQGGSLLLTTSTGLSRLSDGTIRTVAAREGSDSDLFFAIYTDREGIVWLAARTTGIAVLRDGRLTRITTAQGLYHNAVYAITEDAHGSLWFTSSRGVSRVRRSDVLAVVDGTTQSFSGHVIAEADGMRNRECNGGRTPAIWHTRDGRILAPTMDGLVIITPSTVTGNLHRAVPLIEAVESDARVVSTQPRTLAPGDGRLTIRYTAPAFQDADQLRFRYRLDGFDREWVEAGTQRSAHYTNLPPGSYTFRVVVQQLAGAPRTSDETAFQLVLQPHAHQRTSVRAAIALLLLLLIALFIRDRSRSHRQREDDLRRMVSEKTAELAQTNQQLSEANVRLADLSNRDGLTGIANHRAYDERLEEEWRRAARAGGPLSLLIFDIDHFKEFNDRFGHLEGDACLRRVAQGLQRPFRAGDLLARYGGEEFVLILPDTAPEGALTVADDLRQRIEVLRIAHPGNPPDGVLTVSVGVATMYPRSDPEQRKEVFRRADVALYAAKRHGRNRAVPWDRALDPPPVSTN